MKTIVMQNLTPESLEKTVEKTHPGTDIGKDFLKWFIIIRK